jgi:predicted MFS family arabinose efflux permease
MRATVLLLAFIAANANLNLKPILISSYVGFLKLSPSFAGYIVGIEAGISAIVMALAAMLLMKVGAQRMYLLAAGLIVGGNLLSLAAHSFISLALARFIAGIGHGAASAVCAAAIATFASPARISAAVAIVVSIAAMGLMFVIPWMQSLAGIDPLFLAMALLVVPPLLLLYWFPRMSPEANDLQRSSSDSLPFGAVILISMISVGAFYVSVGSFWPFVGEIGKSAGLDYRHASDVAAIAYIAAMAGALAAAFLAEYLRRQILTAASIIGALATQIVLLESPENATVFAACTIAYMFFWGLLYPVFMGFSSEVDPSGRMNGYIGMLATIGIAVGPTLGGAVVGLGATPLEGLHNLLWMSGAFLTLSLLLVYAMQRHGSAQEIYIRAKPSDVLS